MVLTPSLTFEQRLGPAVTLTLPGGDLSPWLDGILLSSFEKILAGGKEVDACLRDRLRCSFSLVCKKYLMLET